MSVMALDLHSASPWLSVMEDDFDSGIFLFKDSQQKVVELAVVETLENTQNDGKVMESVKKAFKAWMDRRQRPFLGKPVQAVDADQVQREAKMIIKTEADLHFHLQTSTGGRKQTRANRRHKIKTRRQRMLKSRK